MKGLPTDKEMIAAIKNLAMTPDGLLLRRYCQMEVNKVATAAEASLGPLLLMEGRRSFARELANVMDERLAESACLDRTGDPSEPIIRQPPGKPVAARDPLRRRVNPYPVAGGKT